MRIALAISAVVAGIGAALLPPLPLPSVVCWSQQCYSVHVRGAPEARDAGTALPEPIVEPATAPTDWRGQFAVDLLRQIGNDRPSQATVDFIIEWTLAEDVGDGARTRNNPLNTTQDSAAATHAINSDGVRGYATYEDGLAATTQTLSYGYYAEIVDALLANDPDRARAALWDSPWAGSQYGHGAGWPYVESPASASSPIAMTGCPLARCVQSGYGFSAGHPGIDLAAESGEPVMATIAGVARVSVTWPCGNGVEVFAGVDSVLVCHLSGFAVEDGAAVQPGAIIGYAGATGEADGVHVHYEIRQAGMSIDPSEGVQ